MTEIWLRLIHQGYRERKMSIEKNPFTHITIVTLVISIPGNIFIIVVNILDFCRNRRLPRCDQLIFGFSVFNLLQGLIDFFRSAITEFNGNIDHIYMYLNMCIILFSTLLALHFCLKIVNINHWLYIGLQRRFPKLFPWPLVIFVVGCFILSLYSTLEKTPKCQLNTTSIDISVSVFLRCSWTSLIVIIYCGLSTILCSVAALTILISLFRHMKRIRKNTAGSRPPNMEAHIGAVKTVTSLLAANIFIFSFLPFSYALFALNKRRWIYLTSFLIPVCNIFSSYFFIKGTKKLDKALKWILSLCSFFTSRNQ